jgi:hypothetical protein
MFTAAVSDAKGTTLPRSGYFWGVHPPQYITSATRGEFHDVTEGSETRVSGWLEMQESHTPSDLIPPYADQLLAAQWAFPDVSILRKTAVVNVALPAWNESTDSPWQEFRRALSPLRLAADAVIEAISDPFGLGHNTSPQAEHAGLSAVARLVDVLGLRRPAVLRMAGVPESTFYAWRKNPGSVIRTPTIGRLLRLQAQVAVLDEALGRDRMRSWLMSADRFERLQGNEGEFAQVLDEAEAALREAVRIVPRRRMRRADYTASSADDVEAGKPETAAWPGAAKISNQEDSPE